MQKYAPSSSCLRAVAFRCRCWRDCYRPGSAEDLVVVAPPDSARGVRYSRLDPITRASGGFDSEPMAAMTATSFALTDRVAVVTGGYGVLGGALAAGLSAAGARIAILGRRRDPAEAKAEQLRHEGAETTALVADVLDERRLAGV